MQLSKSHPLMKEIIEMDRLFHNFSLIEKLKKEKWLFYVDRTEEGSVWRHIGGMEWWEIIYSMSWWYLDAYRRLLPETPPYSDEWIIYILKVNTDELSKMKERIYSEIFETNISKKRWVIVEFLKKLSTRWWRFSGNVLKEGVPSMLEFIPLLYENCEDIEMHFSYEELWKDVYDVTIHLSFSFIEKKLLPSLCPYLEYDEDSRDIIFKGKRIDITPAEVDLLRVFIDEGKSVLDISKIAETIAHSTSLSDTEMKTAKKRHIYNVRPGLNKNLASIFWDTELVYMVGRNGMLHFRFPEFIEEI